MILEVTKRKKRKGVWVRRDSSIKFVCYPSGDLHSPPPRGLQNAADQRAGDSLSVLLNAFSRGGCASRG